MAEIIKNYQQMTVNFFQSSDWDVIHLSKEEVQPVSVEKGKPIRCADSDYCREENHPHTPATFGATEGIAALCEADNIQSRFSLAVQKIEKSGYNPGCHGDNIHGSLYGCKFVDAWINGKLHSLPALSEEAAEMMRFIHKIHHTTLNRKAKAQGLLVNFEPDSTVIPDGRFLTKDIWYLLRLGFKLEDILQQSAHVAGLVLPPEKRKLLIF